MNKKESTITHIKYQKILQSYIWGWFGKIVIILKNIPATIFNFFFIRRILSLDQNM
jgi:hypothetical protein